MRIGPLLLLALLGCGPTAPPRGPRHDPVDSPEPATACPAERTTATAARERLLDPATAGVGAAAAAAAAALAHAACEGAAVIGAQVPAGGRDVVLAGLRALRDRYAAARNLYDEASTYGVQPIAVAALARQAELGLAMATAMSTMALPVDVTDPAERAGLRGEQAELATIFGGEGAVAAERALDAAAGATDPAIRADVAAACAVLGRVDPPALARQPACAPQGRR